MEMQSCHSALPFLSDPQWMPVSGWEKYEVSEDGEIRRNGKVIRQRAQHNGYLRVTFSDEPNGRRKTMMVHRVVAMTFLGEPPTPRHQVDHINGRKTDNRAANLRWVTPRENRRDGQIAVGSQNGSSVLDEMEVLKIRELYDASSRTVQEIADWYGVSRQTITKIGRRRGWTHV